jgi:hypothetical protein
MLKIEVAEVASLDLLQAPRRQDSGFKGPSFKTNLRVRVVVQPSHDKLLSSRKPATKTLILRQLSPLPETVIYDKYCIVSIHQSS